MPPSTATEIGAWLLTAAAIVGLLTGLLMAIYYWRRVFGKPKRRRVPLADQYVTRAELKQVQQEIKAEVDELKTYSQGRFHELHNDVHAVRLEQAAMPVKIRDLIDNALDMQMRPLIIQVTKHTEAIARIEGKLGTLPVDDSSGILLKGS